MRRKRENQPRMQPLDVDHQNVTRTHAGEILERLRILCNHHSPSCHALSLARKYREPVKNRISRPDSRETCFPPEFS